MSRIGKKIIWSYLIIVMLTVLISMSIIRADFEKNLNERIRRDLASDAMNISAQIEEDRVFFQNLYNYDIEADVRDLFPSDAAFKYSVRFASTNIFITNKDKIILYTSWKDDDRNLIDFIKSEEIRSEYFMAESSIRDNNGQVIGYVLTIAKKEDVSAINAMVREASMLGMAMSIIVAVFLAFVFENNITGPIKKLRKNVQNFKIDEADTNEWETINSKDEIADLNRDFQLMTKDLIKYDRQQMEFFQNSSHELKTPLMSIRSYAEAIKDGIVGEEKIDDFLDIIIDESNKLAETVNSIMYMTKLDGDNTAKSSSQISLYEIVEEIITRFSQMASESNIEIINGVDKEITTNISEDHLFRVFSNLILNAMRYAKGHIYVDAQIQSTRPEHVVIEVYDDGEGFEPEDIPRVFDRFFKGNKGISGLGLSIVKSTIHTYGGEVLAYNKEGMGACINIILPIKSSNLS